MPPKSRKFGELVFNNWYFHFQKLPKTKPCPNKCGAFYFPKTSGQCPDYGQIS